MKSRSLTNLRYDEDGIAAVEFGLIGSVFLVMLLGGMDLAHTLYMKTVLEGALQEAGRRSALQSGTSLSQQAALDAQVISQVKNLNRGATVVPTRRFYKSFDAANKKLHERDINTSNPAKENDGVCEVGAETYLDVNNNGNYDVDGGDNGQGGAQDTVIYSVRVSYPRMFPMAGLLGISNTIDLKASTVMQNQPYSAQSQYGPATTRDC